MRVRCIDDRSSCFVYTSELKVGNEYDVLGSKSGMYLLRNEIGYNKWYFKYRFEAIKEEKVEEIRVVRKWEDLTGLKNGLGLEISEEQNVYFGSKVVSHSDAFLFENYLKLLQSMGFKFEYKPLRTIEEVIAEMRTKEIQFTFNGDNCYIKHVASYNKYYVSYDCHDNIMGAIYLDRETASKYCIELNEILKGGK